MTVPDGVETPEVLVDVDVLAANLAREAASTAARGLGLRPHAKTHKIREIARRQLDAGAVGLTVATIGEAEVFAAAGCDDLFVAYPLWPSGSGARRLAAVAERARVAVGVDSVEGVSHLVAVLGDAAERVDVWIEIDSGHHRSGVDPGGAELVSLARTPGLRVSGVFTFPGHSYAPGAAEGAAGAERDALVRARDLLVAAGHEVRQVSGGSTPSAGFSTAPDLTEVRPGVYALGDAQQVELGRCGWEDVALTVAATVVSRHETGARRVVVDAGSKVLGGDRPAWATGFGRVLGHPDARVKALSEHHGTVVWPDDAPLPRRGERLRLVPNHVCLVPNLVDDVAVVRDGVVVDRWAVAARGRNR
jgi:D-serine deaminase-like pyridoxal phosphate-dependent protein